MDQGEVTALTLLDLSAAFDTIDHATTINKKTFRLVWNILAGSNLVFFLFAKWASIRKQVKIKDTLSYKVTLSYGVPQGSVLGPGLFTLYTTPLSAIISSFDINHHLYVDNTQFYMSLFVSNAKESLENSQHCVMAVLAWMTGSRLKLNPSKTDILLIGTNFSEKHY